MTSSDRKIRMPRFGWLLHACGLLPVVAAAAIYYLAMYAPLQAESRRMSERTATLERLLKQAPQIHREHAELMTSLASVEHRAARVRQRIPLEPNEAEFLRQLTEAATQEGLLIQDYSRGGVSEKTGFSQLDVRLICEGDYRGLCGFVNRLEQFSRISKIREMRVGSNAANTRYPVEFTIVLYFGAGSPEETDPEVTHG